MMRSSLNHLIFKPWTFVVAVGLLAVLVAFAGISADSTKANTGETLLASRFLSRDPDTGFLLFDPELLNIDPTSGAATEIGPLSDGASSHVVQGLAYDECTDTLFGALDTELVEIDLVDGSVTSVGPYGAGIWGMKGLSVSPAPDCGLYGVSYQSTEDSLFSIDKGTGSATRVGSLWSGLGPLVIGCGANSPRSLAFHPTTGTLYATNYTSSASNAKLITIDTVSGSCTDVGTISGGTFIQVDGLAFDDSGNLYGINNASGTAVSDAHTIAIDYASSPPTASPIGSADEPGGSVLGLTFGPAGTPPDPDLDGDGIPASTDCDDSDPTVYPGATEVPYDGVDQDCDGADLTDQDGDGYDGGTGGSDCDDSDPAINPGAEEVSDGVDNDCDGVVTAGDELIASGVPGKGLEGAPGLSKPGNPKSKSGDRRGKK